PALQQLVVQIGGGAAPRLGVPGPLGQQTHRRSRSHRARARTDEPAQRTRLTHMARLSVGSLIKAFGVTRSLLLTIHRQLITNNRRGAARRLLIASPARTEARWVPAENPLCRIRPCPGSAFVLFVCHFLHPLGEA